MSDFKIVKLLDPISLTLTGPNFQGEYSSGTTYQTGMSVSYNGSSYVALQTTTGNVPTNITYWQLLASKGDNGAGSVAFTCRNSTGVAIQAFRVVYINGSTGNEPNITLALGDNDPNSSKTFGVTPLVINNNTNGTVVHNGEIDNLNTSAFTAGDLLWLSPTTPGLVTTTRPSAPNHAVFIGYIVRAHPNQGKIIVTIQNGFELNELHNVLINGISNGQVIQYESATQLWKNHTLASSDVGLGNVPNVDATNPANIAQDANHRFVTDTEKTTWNGKENAITAGTTSQYYRGDKTFQTLDKNAVGLSNVDNTSDANKPVSTATQNALNSITNVNWTGDYNNGVTYSVGDGVMYNGASFRMISFIGAAGYPPSAYPANWIQVTDYLSPNDIGLGNIDNTSDANKPVSTAQATAIGLKVDKSGDTMTGTLYNDVSLAVKGGTSGHYVSLIGPTSLGSNTSLTLPEGSGTLLSTVTYAQVANKDLNYNSVYTTASGFGYVQLDPSGSTGNSRARLIFNNTANNDYTFPNATGTVVLSSSLGSYVLKAGDSMTGPLEINGTSGNFSGVLVGNSDATGTSQFTCGNGTTSIMSIGATNASFSNPLAGPNQGFLYSQNGIYSITNQTDGFNWVQNGSNVASIKNNSFTAISIDAVPVNFSGLTTNTATNSDYVPFTNGSTNYKTSLNDMPVSAPQNLNSIVNAIIFG